MKKKHENHPKVNHPGSKDQLKEVWEEADGLDPNDFDPKTFFKLHDVNSDGFLDEQELEALFTKEVNEFIKYSVALLSLFPFYYLPFFYVGF